ncbi:hypothetical protein [Succinivibrio dextrinosolvens]|uniref:ATP-grasp domain-containing protein n=1 Tax=Succinivibrio dextrinosolvens TaxID=83771 RepID=A0A662ZAD0_9GAMM|nr:hypothetical protein [Succinivibrio dextrinosolvens]SFK20776.1 hypothetical protein SAMN04487865_103726 [Succinivibrio dextrinosolvens]
MYLILAIDEDVHADAVLYYLEKYGKKVKRFDPAFLFDEYGSIETEARREKILVDISSTSGKLIFPNGDIVSSDDIEGVYCRSFYIPKAKDSSSTSDQLATAEIRSTVRGFFSLIPQCCRWINNPYTEDKVDNKIYQHQCAIAHGLDVPDTLVTNCADNVKSFYEKHNGKIIIKQLSDISLIDENPFVNENGYNDVEFKGFYTSPVNASDLASLEEYFGPGSAPVLLQEALCKKSELRVTIIGDKCFTYRIFSQENQKSKIDFRRVDELRTEKSNLPEEIREKLTSLLKFWGINFAAVDLVENTDGRIVFLEANVVGNWLWLEKDQEGSEIAQAITEVLVKES